ncbi:MAG: LssY C-terminal domain-containing protein [Planctomycetota bacterium]
MTIDRFATAVFVVAAAGCQTFDPVPLEEVPFLERVKTREGVEVVVKVAVPTAEQAEAIYGVDLASKGVQPVWVEVENRGDLPYWFLPTVLDPQYFLPSEAAYAYHRGKESRREAIEGHFEDLAFSNPVPPQARVGGFVLVNQDQGYKAVDIDVVSAENAESFVFVFVDPTFAADFQQVDLGGLWTQDQVIAIDDARTLRTELERLPQCTTNKKGTAEGDPLNLVVIGKREEIFTALVRRGWHATESISWGSIGRTLGSFFTGSRYRYSPISPLYVYGRHQDFSAQRARSTINERNHMRFWLTPIRYQDKEVWVGQISRDIGVKFTFKSPTISTHVIDPDVDEARRHFLEDMAYSQSLEAFGLVAGVGPIARDDPRENLVGDPFFTDGKRAVLIFEPRPNSLDMISQIDWTAGIQAEDLP